MNMSLALAINIVLGAAVFLAILTVLAFGIRSDAKWRTRFAFVAERRRGADRRRATQPVPPLAERRRTERRDPLTA